ncbi:MAG: pyruvate, water dikinase, partial [Syntrophaceae bacterium]|nr:pyruvate, water dikinase [Syntrophaceae bacterium]
MITAAGFHRFIEANDLREEIARRSQMIDPSDLEEVFHLSDSLQKLLETSPVPDDLAAAIAAHAKPLAAANPKIRFAVRSSAIGEDAQGASFAGQYRT